MWAQSGFTLPFAALHILCIVCVSPPPRRLAWSDCPIGVFVCYARLFQTVANQRQLSEVQALLMGHVAPSCFVSHDCTTAGIK